MSPSPLLVELSGTVVPEVVAHCVASQERLHDFGDGCRAGLKQQVEMIAHQGVGAAGGPGVCQRFGEALENILLIPGSLENIAALDTSYHDVMQSAGEIDSALTWHD